MDEQDLIDVLRANVVEAQTALWEAVARACPGKHRPVQHRDMQPPWCPDCKRTYDGVPVDRP